MKSWKITITTWIFCTISVVFADRWSSQLQNFLPEQVNDWVPLQNNADRSLRYAFFPSHLNLDPAIQHSVSYNSPFNKFSFGTQVETQTTGVHLPTAQPFIQQTPNINYPQQQKGDQDVQLLYVPLETFNKKKSGLTFDRFNGLAQNVNAALINNFYESETEQPNSQLTTSTTTSHPSVASSNYYAASVRPNSPNLRPYQPPLAIFQLSTGKPTSLNDVLIQLKSASAIDVLDAPSNRRPKVFIGPHDMVAPRGYTKFDLPYLSSVDWGRTGRKIEALPFFVAPLSYNTPPGFAKIPLPAPHVGSVVINTPMEKQIKQVLSPNPVNYSELETVTVNLLSNHNSLTKPLTQGFEEKGLSTNRYAGTPSPQIKGISPTKQPSSNYVHKILDDYSTTSVVTPASHSQVPYQSTTRAPDNFGNDYKLSLTSAAPQTFFSSLGDDDAQNNFSQFVHKFKLVDSVKPDYKATKQPDYFTYNTNSKFVTSNVFLSSANSPLPRKPSDRPSQFEFNDPPSTRRSITSIDSSVKTTPITPSKEVFSTPKPEEESTPLNFHRPTTFVATDGTLINLNGQYLTNIGVKNLKDADIELNPYEKYPDTNNQNPLRVPNVTIKPFAEDDRFALRRRPVISTPPFDTSQQYKHVSRPSYTPTRPANNRRPTESAELLFNKESTKTYKFKSEAQTLSSTIEVSTQNPNFYDGHNSNLTTETLHELLNAATPNPTPNPASEIPSISPVLPGLINSLTDDKWMDTNKNVMNTRIPIRGRNPQSSSLAIKLNPEKSRSRRPSSTLPSNFDFVSSTNTPNRDRNIVRNPNRVKYNPTPEERQRLRSRGRTSSSKNEKEKVVKDLEYQRDVLKQNYPVAKPNLTLITTSLSPDTLIGKEKALSHEIDTYIVKNEPVDDIPFNHTTDYRDDRLTIINKDQAVYTKSENIIHLPPAQDTVMPNESTTEINDDRRKNFFNRKSNSHFTTFKPPATSTSSESSSIPGPHKGRRRPNFSLQPSGLQTVTTPTKLLLNEPTEVSEQEETSKARGQFRLKTIRPAQIDINSRKNQNNTRSRAIEESNRRQQSIATRTQVNPSQQSGEVTQIKPNIRGRQRSRFRLETQETRWPTDLNDNAKPDTKNSPNKIPSEEEVHYLTGSQQGDIKELSKDSIAEQQIQETTVHPEAISSAERDIENREPSVGENNAIRSAKRRGYWKKIRVKPIDTLETAESQHVNNIYYNALVSEIKEDEKPIESKEHHIRNEKERKNTAEKNFTQFKNYLDKSGFFITTTEIPTNDETLKGEKIKKKVRVKVIKRPTEFLHWSRNESPTFTETQLTKDDAINNKSSEEDETTTSEPSTTTHIAEKYISEDSNTFDEVKRSLKELFRMDEQDEEDILETTPPAFNGGFTTTDSPGITIRALKDDFNQNVFFTPTTVAPSADPLSKTMGSVILATSTSKQISQETEICYRGRCIKTDTKFNN